MVNYKRMLLEKKHFRFWRNFYVGVILFLGANAREIVLTERMIEEKNQLGFVQS